MNIRHNIQGMMANQSFAKSIYQQRKAMDRISTGVKVNKSGDDPATMALSYKMKSQINGLSMAKRNSEDGISLIRTAESGLSEIQTHLTRMRELCLQAANGTLNDDDRKKVQEEIRNLEKGIDNIANYTEFNTINVLAPPIIKKDPPPPPKVDSVDVVFLLDNSSTMGGYIDSVKKGIEGFLNSFDGSLNIKISIVNLCEESVTLDFTSDVEEIKKNLGDTKSNTTKSYEVIKETVPGGKIGDQLSYGDNSKKVFVMFTDTYDETVGNPGYSGTKDEALSGVEGANIIDGYDDDIQVYSFLFNDYSGVAKDAYESIVDSTGGKIYNPVDANDIKDKLINDLSNDIKDNIPPDEPEYEEGKLKDILVQKGANENELMCIRLMDARAKSIGIEELSVLTAEEAANSLNRIDNAISLVSRQRALFGAYDNGLGMIYDNLGEKEINLTGSDSRLMDTDIGKEVMNLSIADILSNTSQAMLTQSIRVSESLSIILQNWR